MAALCPLAYLKLEGTGGLFHVVYEQTIPLCPGEIPHEKQLHEEGIEEEKLCSLVLLHPRVCVHRTARISGALRKKNVFERPHLSSISSHNPGSIIRVRQGKRTRKKELAMKV